METTYQLSGHPLFFARNRVFRVYQGGKLFHGFFGDPPEDGCYPEEWIASAVEAINSGGTHPPHEGVSRIEDTDIYLDELLRAEPKRMLGGHKPMGILVKALDSAIRLPIQAHPDKAFSRRYFHSEFGKAEMWLVLATRENACIYFGFRQPVTPEQFCAAVQASETDKDAMEALLNRIPVKPGDVFFIPAKAVHAIGAGCLILEIQEPTDFTIQPEAWCGDYHLNDEEKYLGLPMQDALKCFDYSLSGSAAEQTGRKTPRLLSQQDGVCSEELLGKADTDCFRVRRHRLEAAALTALCAPSVCVVTDGEGTVRCGDFSRQVKKGDYFFLPYAAAGQCRVETGTALELVECLPPET